MMGTGCLGGMIGFGSFAPKKSSKSAGAASGGKPKSKSMGNVAGGMTMVGMRVVKAPKVQRVIVPKKKK
jgi:hypothetical protein